MEARHRAPRRTGHRTTLRVPDDVLSAARTLARELGTTTNDAVVRLAEEGAAARERRRRLDELSAERRAAVAGSDDAAPAGLPAPEDLRRAMLSGRHAS